MRIFLFLILCFLIPGIADARSQKAKHDFAKVHPCPATERHIARCPGYVIDHIIPLCAGGADAPKNMQWQVKRDSYKKDKEERATCRALRILKL